MEEIDTHPNNNKQDFETPLRSEVEEAMRKTANRKAAGIDDVPIELLKLGQDEAVNIIHKLCSKIWQTGEWPNDWLAKINIRSNTKKGDRKERTNYRTIALIAHTSKVMLRVILNRIDKKMEDEA